MFAKCQRSTQHDLVTANVNISKKKKKNPPWATFNISKRLSYGSSSQMSAEVWLVFRLTLLSHLVGRIGLNMVEINILVWVKVLCMVNKITRNKQIYVQCNLLCVTFVQKANYFISLDLISWSSSADAALSADLELQVLRLSNIVSTLGTSYPWHHNSAVQNNLNIKCKINVL